MTSQLYHFHGGLHLDPHKSESLTHSIISAAIPNELILPVQQNIGSPSSINCQVGDYVYKGQIIAKTGDDLSVSLHAPSSGTITAIESKPIPHPSGLNYPCIVIQPDHKDTWLTSILNNQRSKEFYRALNRKQQRELIQNSGVVGLGGAAFPSHLKMSPKTHKTIHTLIINAAECEPYISCDNALIQESSLEILQGIKILMHVLKAQRCIIGIEDNMNQAISALSQALAHCDDSESILLRPIPTLYPSGGEKQLIKVLTGKEVPHHGLPLDLGMVCHNIGTAYALFKAIIENEPLISRIVTITGPNVRNPGNYRVLIGTPIYELIKQAGGYIEPRAQLIMGGPMMGFTLSSDRLPIVKASNCILVNSQTALSQQDDARACIRCGDCAEVCPVKLLPQQLYWYTRSKEFDKTQQYNLFDCIECGCCAYVCPSHIPLVQYYRYAKTEIWSMQHEKDKAKQAKQRFNFRTKRLEKIKQELEEKRRRKKAALNKSLTTESDKQQKKLAIQQAVARVKQRQSQQPTADAMQRDHKKQSK